MGPIKVVITVVVANILARINFFSLAALYKIPEKRLSQLRRYAKRAQMLWLFSLCTAFISPNYRLLRVQSILSERAQLRWSLPWLWLIYWHRLIFLAWQHFIKSQRNV